MPSAKGMSDRIQGHPTEAGRRAQLLHELREALKANAAGDLEASLYLNDMTVAPQNRDETLRRLVSGQVQILRSLAAVLVVLLADMDGFEPSTPESSNEPL